jgi:hypothetical protein
MYYTTRGVICVVQIFWLKGTEAVCYLPCKADMKEVSEAVSATITVQEYNSPQFAVLVPPKNTGSTALCLLQPQKNLTSKQVGKYTYFKSLSVKLCQHEAVYFKWGSTLSKYGRWRDSL